MKRFIALVLIPLTMLTGCMSATQHASKVNSVDGNEMTVGTVQRAVKIGMSEDEVISVLGSPNIVTSRQDGGQSFVYDKVSTQVTYSKSSSNASVSGGIASLPMLLIGGASVGGSSSAGSVAQTQKTLTVIIKFDAEGKVFDFAYHASKF